MKFSLNEIEVHGKKAVRGAGFEWGYAEEMGKAQRWLAMYDLPGARVLAAYLAHPELHGDLFQVPNKLTKRILKADGSALYCPVLTGAWLCDRSSIDLPQKIKIESLAYPLLLLPYLAFIARDQQKSMAFRFEQNRFCYADQQLNAEVGSRVAADDTNSASIVFSDDSVAGNRTIDFEQDVEEKDWQLLNQFASRTYVPASEISRQGAGSEEDRLR